jgi:hypothetical protein
VIGNLGTEYDASIWGERMVIYLFAGDVLIRLAQDAVAD